MFSGRLVWDKMFTGRLVGGRSIQAPGVLRDICIWVSQLVRIATL
jgi:hypothetical protein